MGNAVVTRDAAPDATGHTAARMEIHGEYLHFYTNTERVTSNKPVELLRGEDRLSGDNMSFDNISQVLEMNGRVKAQLMPRTGAQQP
jgi:lipopolysaccharide export system protein LptC